MDKLTKFNLPKQAAIDYIATHISATNKDIANLVGISVQTLAKWRKDPNFVDAIYKKYMTYAGNQLPLVTQALIEEGKSGNVHAAKVILEHFGKLSKNIHIKIQSPFDNWLSTQEIDYEMVENKTQDPLDAYDTQDITHISLPQVTIKPSKKADYNRKQREWYHLRNRAKRVGMKIFEGRTSKGRRKAWLNELERRESKGIVK